MVGYIFAIRRDHEKRNKGAVAASGTTIQQKVSKGETNITCNRTDLLIFIYLIAIRSRLEPFGVRASTYGEPLRRRRVPKIDFPSIFVVKDRFPIW